MKVMLACNANRLEYDCDSFNLKSFCTSKNVMQVGLNMNVMVFI